MVKYQKASSFRLASRSTKAMSNFNRKQDLADNQKLYFMTANEMTLALSIGTCIGHRSWIGRVDILYCLVFYKLLKCVFEYYTAF